MKIPFMSKKPTMEELENEKERAIIEEEIMTKRAETAERQAVISELKKKYGGGWMSLLGVNKLTDVSTLRSFLKGSKQGMEKFASQNKMNKMYTMQGVKRA